VIRRLDGSGGQTDEAINAAFARLAADFNPHNIFFVRACEVIDIPVSEIEYNSENACVFWNDPLYQHNNGIDMFFGSEDNSEYIGGKASNIPGKNMWISGTWPTGAGSPWNVTNSPVVSHEMGHCLGLFHPFHGTIPESVTFDCNVPAETGCCELVNGSNRCLFRLYDSRPNHPQKV